MWVTIFTRQKNCIWVDSPACEHYVGEMYTGIKAVGMGELKWINVHVRGANNFFQLKFVVPSFWANRYLKMSRKSNAQHEADAIAEAQHAAQVRAMRKEDSSVTDVVFVCSYVVFFSNKWIDPLGMRHSTSSRTARLYIGKRWASKDSSIS